MAVRELRTRVAAALARRPLATSLAMLAVLGTVRVVDVVALRLWRRPGALVTSTLAVCAVGWVLARPVDGVGTLRVGRDGIRRAVLVGVVAVGAVQVAARGTQVLALVATGSEPVVVVRARNPILEVADPVPVAAYLLFGTLLTAVGEELLFRRALLGPLAERYGFWRGNAVQAGLFGLWHLAWPLVYLLVVADPYPSVPVYAAGVVWVTTVVGVLYGWLVRSTGTVWTAVAAHLTHNAATVVLHVDSAAGEVRGGAGAAATLVGYLCVALWAAGRWRRSPPAAETAETKGP